MAPHSREKEIEGGFQLIATRRRAESEMRLAAVPFGTLHDRELWPTPPESRPRLPSTRERLEEAVAPPAARWGCRRRR